MTTRDTMRERLGLFGCLLLGPAACLCGGNDFGDTGGDGDTDADADVDGDVDADTDIGGNCIYPGPPYSGSPVELGDAIEDREWPGSGDNETIALHDFCNAYPTVRVLMIYDYSAKDP